MRGIRKAASRATGVSNAFGGKKQKAEEDPAQKRQDMISELENNASRRQLLPPPEEAPVAEEKSEAPPAAASAAEVEPFEPPPPATDGPLVWPLFSKTQGLFFTLPRGERLAQATELRYLRDHRIMLLGSKGCEYACGQGELDAQIIRESLAVFAEVMMDEQVNGQEALVQLDRRFQALRAQLADEDRKNTERAQTDRAGAALSQERVAKIARQEVACGLALINAMLSGTISQWEDARAQRKANGEPDDGTPFYGDDPVTPYDLAGYITFTWSQCYWALLPVSSEVRHRTAEAIRTAINNRIVEYDGLPYDAVAAD